jgi:hypothetical protein
MAIKFDTVKPGDVLYSVHKYKVGNVRGMTATGTWPVHIISIADDGMSAMVSRPGRPDERLSRRRIEALRRSPHKPRQSMRNEP